MTSLKPSTRLGNIAFGSICVVLYGWEKVFEWRAYKPYGSLLRLGNTYVLLRSVFENLSFHIFFFQLNIWQKFPLAWKPWLSSLPYPKWVFQHSRLQGLHSSKIRLGKWGIIQVPGNSELQRTYHPSRALGPSITTFLVTKASRSFAATLSLSNWLGWKVLK